MKHNFDVKGSKIIKLMFLNQMEWIRDIVEYSILNQSAILFYQPCSFYEQPPYIGFTKLKGKPYYMKIPKEKSVNP